MSTKDEDGMPLTYVGCQVTLQHRKTAQFGRANQKWTYDKESGFIFAFASSGMDKGIFKFLFVLLRQHQKFFSNYSAHLICRSDSCEQGQYLLVCCDGIHEN